MRPGHLERPWTGPAAIGGQATAEGAWRPEAGREPPLAELLDDPIMALLWRADKLDPAAARATVRALQARVPAVTRAESPARGGHLRTVSDPPDLAA